MLKPRWGRSVITTVLVRSRPTGIEPVIPKRFWFSRRAFSTSSPCRLNSVVAEERPQSFRNDAISITASYHDSDPEPHSNQAATHPSKDEAAPVKSHRRPDLPLTCPGCGALTQTAESDEAGFFTPSRRSVREYLKRRRRNATVSSSEVASNTDLDTELDVEIVENTIEHEGSWTMTEELTTIPIDFDEPICDRCHNLLHNATGVSIAHPSLDAIADSIAESPHSRNHVYHVLDAADFPMSLITTIHKKLSLAKPRSRNRRSQYDFSRRPTLDFIITRSDLLGPTKEMVDSLLPQFRELLRNALSRSDRDARLGNLHLVSSKRGWWTKEIKEDIWRRGGGNWMVGKVNVGKSNLFEVLFPKGHSEIAPSYAELERDAKVDDTESAEVPLLSETSLLPPSQPSKPYPTLPIVSALAGTTASPIRLPFGDSKGELVDLPGLARSDPSLSLHPSQKPFQLVMQTRPTVAQYIIKPGSSLLLGGGLIRITPHLDPNDRSTTMLAYPFTPPILKPHVTSTQKAIQAQQQQRNIGNDSLLAEGAGQTVKIAGTFELKTDVTRQRAGKMLAAWMSLEQLPFRVYATDVLIEGIGWVEIVCQTRKRRFQAVKPGVNSHGEGVDMDVTSQIRRVDNIPPVLSHSASNTDTIDTAEPSPLDLSTTYQPLQQNESTTASTFSTSTSSTPNSLPTSTSSTYPPHPVLSDQSTYPQISIYTLQGVAISTRPSLSLWPRWEASRTARVRARHGGRDPVRPRKSMRGVEKKAKMERRDKLRMESEGAAP